MPAFRCQRAPILAGAAALTVSLPALASPRHLPAMSLKTRACYSRSLGEGTHPSPPTPVPAPASM